MRGAKGGGQRASELEVEKEREKRPAAAHPEVPELLWGRKAESSGWFAACARQERIASVTDPTDSTTSQLLGKSAFPATPLE